MRRFERLRKLARQLAAENGHTLGQFREMPVVRLTSTGLLTEMDWHEASCIKCGADVMINTTVDPINLKGHNIWQAPMEVKALGFARHLNSITADGETKLPFPKRAKGAMYGKALTQKCELLEE